MIDKPKSKPIFTTESKPPKLPEPSLRTIPAMAIKHWPNQRLPEGVGLSVKDG